MLLKIFTTQWNFPAKRNEWTEQVRVDLEDLGLVEDLIWIKSKTKFTFKNLVKKQIRELALQKLLQRKQGHSKMNNLDYTTLEMADYLKDQKITATQAKILFKLRTRMENYSENFKGGSATKPCPLCGLTEDTQEHSFQCRTVKENICVKGKFTDIFKLKVEQEVAKTAENIVKWRKDYKEN